MSDVVAPLSGLSVLIVEDEPLVAIMLEDYVEGLGCRFAVTTGSTGSALETIENIEPDLVILDVLVAPDGEPDFSIADELARRRTPFVFCSGHHRGILPDRYRSRPSLASRSTIATTGSAAAVQFCTHRREPTIDRPSMT